MKGINMKIKAWIVTTDQGYSDPFEDESEAQKCAEEWRSLGNTNVKVEEVPEHIFRDVGDEYRNHSVFGDGNY